jgi:hypothetical protein
MSTVGLSYGFEFGIAVGNAHPTLDLGFAAKIGRSRH